MVREISGISLGSVRSSLGRDRRSIAHVFVSNFLGDMLYQRGETFVLVVPRPPVLSRPLSINVKNVPHQRPELWESARIVVVSGLWSDALCGRLSNWLF